MSVKADETLDLQGLKCPLPALLAKRAVKHSVDGRIVEVVADDPMAAVDLPHMCRQENIEILLTERCGDRVRFLLRAG